MTTIRSSRLRPSLRLGALVVAATLTAAASAVRAQSGLLEQPDDVIQPGDSLGFEELGVWFDSCTLNFVFDGGRSVYIGTAAHCVEIGELVSTPGFDDLGSVVFDDDVAEERECPVEPGKAATDFALVAVDPDLEGYVDGAVKGHPGTPTGHTAPRDTRAGDLLLHSGYGAGVGLTAPTREERVSVLIGDDASSYRSDGMVVNGDSGGPILHSATGKALGIVSHFNPIDVPPTTDEGPTVQRILARLAYCGFFVTLRTD